MKIMPLELWIKIEKILPHKKIAVGRSEFCPNRRSLKTFQNGRNFRISSKSYLEKIF